MKEILPDATGKGQIDKLIMAEMDHIRMLSTARNQLLASGGAAIS